MKTPVKVKVLKGFALNLQGSYKEGDVVTLHFGRIQSIGILTPGRYERLLRLGCFELIKEIKKEITDGSI